MPVPIELRTARLLLRPWRAADAAGLHPVLEANRAHLEPWIPARVATPAPIPVLAQRLAGFAADFATAREWRYGLFSRDEREVLGEIGLYPRAASGRVPYADADCVELGYWLRTDATGQGLVTEAARALLAVAAALPHLSHVEIRCDARNVPSAAVPRRLGFVLATTILEPGDTPTEPSIEVQVWTSTLTSITLTGV
jgi:RimJ/RimL family protein N-acetyltransferase